jgi:predicted secreted hydrolase
LVFLPYNLLAQSFSGLGSTAEGFAVPAPNTNFDFPLDHGPHNNYRIEWWYLTANLSGEDQTPYGIQWTLFRTARSPNEENGWLSNQIWFAHAAITTPNEHFTTERFARGGIGQAGVNAEPFEAWIDEWKLVGKNFDELSLNAAGPNFGYDMSLEAEGPLVFHGDKGYSVKSSEGQASYYYSQPFFKMKGTLTLPEGDINVEGNAWLDREWSSQPLAENQLGWDWFSLSLDNGAKLMGFQLRQTDGLDFSSSSWIEPDGSLTSYGNNEFVAEPVKESNLYDKKIPTEWRLKLKDQNLDVIVKALNPNSWMNLSIPYWEGPVAVSGSHSGLGYLEMTGY